MRSLIFVYLATLLCIANALTAMLPTALIKQVKKNTPMSFKKTTPSLFKRTFSERESLHQLVITSSSTLIQRLKSGANPNLQDEHGNTPLHLAAQLPYNEPLVALLNCKNIQVNASNNKGKTPLMAAAESERICNTTLLLEHPQISTIAVDKDGNTALNHAIKHTDVFTSKLLLLKNPHLLLTENHEEEISLHIAAQSSLENLKEELRIKKIQALINLLVPSSDVAYTCFSKDKQGNSPLHKAASSGHPWFFVQLLSVYSKLVPMDRSASINFKLCVNNMGQTPLHLAAQNNNHAAIKAIMNHEQTAPWLSVKNKKGETPIVVAAGQNNKDTVELLLSLYNKQYYQKI